MGSDKEFHVFQLVAACVRKECTPRKVGFADYILRLCAAYFQYERRTARQYVDILIQSFRHDRWKGLVETNVFLKEKERQEWILTHS